MKRFALSICVVALHATYSYAQDDSGKALELLALSLQCPHGDDADYSKSTTVKVDSSVATFTVTEQWLKTDFQTDYLGPRKETYEYHVSFRLGQLSEATAEGEKLKLQCVGDRNCMIVFEPFFTKCQSTKSAGPTLCLTYTNPDRPIVQSKHDYILSLCRGQADRAAVALNIVNDHGRDDDENLTATVVGNLPANGALAIRGLPDPTAPKVGAIPVASGPVDVGECKKPKDIKGTWCRVKWGGYAGFASAKYLVRLDPTKAVEASGETSGDFEVPAQ